MTTSNEDYIREIVALRKRVDELTAEREELKDRIRELDGTADADEARLISREFSLSRTAGQVMQVFLRSKAPVVTREHLIELVWNNRAVDEHITDPYVTKCRAALAARGFELKTVWGMGWFMPDDVVAGIVKIIQARRRSREGANAAA